MGAVVIILLFIQMILGEEEKKRVVFIYELCDFSGVDFVDPWPCHGLMITKKIKRPS